MKKELTSFSIKKNTLFVFKSKKSKGSSSFTDPTNTSSTLTGTWNKQR